MNKKKKKKKRGEGAGSEGGGGCRLFFHPLKSKQQTIYLKKAFDKIILRVATHWDRSYRSTRHVTQSQYRHSNNEISQDQNAKDLVEHPLGQHADQGHGPSDGDQPEGQQLLRAEHNAKGLVEHPLQNRC